MNFALLLFSLLVITGIVTALDAVYFGRHRAAGSKEPWWIEYPKSFFPVILIVFLVRSFVVEPFKIPSGSMIPTLLVGDYILVNKYTYGIRLPILNTKIISIHEPKRGDVMVFRYPDDPSVDYIKRVVGLPGDKIAYEGKRLTINGHEVPEHYTGDYLLKDRIEYLKEYTETLGKVKHSILLDPSEPAATTYVKQYPDRQDCIYNNNGVMCTVPPGHYFMMGDNRDNSSDSRVWGFVPEANIIGKAFFIWFNFSQLGRFGRLN
ncbi:MAG TPA: signal peptidase I [Burkholderiales bacterium]|nr:signal peptidase I [Burkholderiales bacterium]